MALNSPGIPDSVGIDELRMTSLLVDRLAQQEEQLLRSLERAETPAEVAGKVQRWLAELADIGGEYMRGLDLQRAKASRRFLALLDAGCETFKALRPTVLQPYEPPARRLLGLPRRFVVRVAEALGLRARTRTHNGAGQGPTIDVDGKALSMALRHALEVIDSAVQKLEPPPPASPGRLQDHVEVLRALQQLLGDAHRDDHALPERTRESIRYITAELEREQIRVRFFGDRRKLSTELKDEAMFDIQESLDSSCRENTTLLPCMLGGDRVLLRGSVVGPARPAKK